MATYRKATDAEKRMCQAVLDDAKAGNAAKAAAQLLIDGDLPIEEGRTAGDAIRSSIESNLSERAATIAMSTGCSEDEARKAARTPDFGSKDNWDVPEAVSSFDSNPSSFDIPHCDTESTDPSRSGDRYDFAPSCFNADGSWKLFHKWISDRIEHECGMFPVDGASGYISIDEISAIWHSVNGTEYGRPAWLEEEDDADNE